MTVQGIKGMERRIKALGNKGRKALLRGLFKGGRYLQRESQKIVPRKTGDLHRSADTRKVPEAPLPTVIVFYGTNYGIYVHENLEARHKPGKQAKFLEQPLREKRQEIRKVVVLTIKGDLL